MFKKIGFVAFLLTITVFSVYAGNRCTPQKTEDGCRAIDICKWDNDSRSCKLNCENLKRSDCSHFPTHCKWTNPPRGEGYCAFKGQ